MPQSLARRNDGCHECCKRRVKCDKAEPECFKCKKKGIKCSGQSVGFHFRKPATIGTSSASPSISKKHRRQSKRQPTASPPTTSSPNSTLYETEAYQEIVDQKLYTDLIQDASPAESSITLSPIQPDPDGWLSLVRTQDIPLLSVPSETVPPGMRMLFSHFCNHIAPMMVVFDFAGNGYRDCILPLATQSDVLARAVSVVAAFHLAQKAPQLHHAALLGHQAIFEKLRKDSLESLPEKISNPYTWATILVLLVGETITGTDNYLYLLEMLGCLRQMPDAIGALPHGLQEFLTQQGEMFELFGFPMSDEAKGLNVLQRRERYMNFMAYPALPTDSEHLSTLQIIRQTFRDAFTLYQRRALSSAATEDSIPHVEQLRQRISFLDVKTPGVHALVWPCFVAAAESVLPEHRLFFSSRLRELHGITGFGSIPSALKALETIWALQGVERWTEIVCKNFPILVM